MKLKKMFFNALIFCNWIRKQLEKQQQIVLCTECLYLTGRGGERFVYVSQSEDILLKGSPVPAGAGSGLSLSSLLQQ